jgi:Holliday junction resolvase-like predicted endonuclease
MKNKNENIEANEPAVQYSRPLNFDDVWKMFQETGEQMKDTDLRMKETDRRMKKLQDLFTTQWGKLIESLVEGDLVKLLNQRGIQVQRTTQNVDGKYGDVDYEFDIIAVNGDEIVIVEVKTTLRTDDVIHFLSKLEHAKTWMTEYKNHKIIGAMACLVEQSGSMKMAMKHGLLAIKATGGSASIVNRPGFEPKKW